MGDTFLGEKGSFMMGSVEEVKRKCKGKVTSHNRGITSEKFFPKQFIIQPLIFILIRHNSPHHRRAKNKNFLFLERGLD